MLKIAGKLSLNGDDINCQALEKVLTEAIANKNLNELLNSLDGNFSLIFETAAYTMLVTDNISSFPIYYFWDNTRFKLIDRDKNLCLVNSDVLFEMLCVGYSLKEQTKYNNVYGVPRHSYVLYDKIDCKLVIKSYRSARVCQDKEFKFTYRNLDSILDKFFSLQIPEKSANILLPLSGGLDSRLLAFYLRSRGYLNVLCFTYGTPLSKEVEKSKEIADLLDFEWIFLDYNTATWKNVSRRYQDYFYSYNFESVNHYQDLPAIFDLLQRGVIDESYTVIPGHSLDLLMGTHDIPAIEGRVVNSANSWLLKLFIYTKFYSLNNCSDIGKNLGVSRISIFRRKLYAISGLVDYYIARYKGKKIHDLMYDLNVNNRQAKFIVRSVEVYHMHNLHALLPFWCFELEEFFTSMPDVMKRNRKFQKEYIQHLAKDVNINLGAQGEESTIGAERRGLFLYVINSLRLIFKDVFFQSTPKLLHELKWFCLYDDLLDKGFRCRSIYGFNSLKSYQEESRCNVESS